MESRTFSFKISNSMNIKGTFVLFGWDMPKDLQSDYVKVLVSEISPTAKGKEMDGNYTCIGAKFVCKNTNQFKNKLFVQNSKTADGIEIDPLNITNPFLFEITDDNYIIGEIEPKTKYRIVLTVTPKNK